MTEVGRDLTRSSPCTPKRELRDFLHFTTPRDNYEAETRSIHLHHWRKLSTISPYHSFFYDPPLNNLFNVCVSSLCINQCAIILFSLAHARGAIATSTFLYQPEFSGICHTISLSLFLSTTYSPSSNFNPLPFQSCDFLDVDPCSPSGINCCTKTA